jgi:hypothetical protein
MEKVGIFLAIWQTLRPFGNFVAIWYIFHPFIVSRKSWQPWFGKRKEYGSKKFIHSSTL